MILGRLIIAGMAAGFALVVAAALGWPGVVCLLVFIAVYTLGIFLV